MLSSVLLICAVVASLAVGVFVAQGLCMAMFHVLQVRAKHAAASRALESASVKNLRTIS